MYMNAYCHSGPTYRVVVLSCPQKLLWDLVQLYPGKKKERNKQIQIWVNNVRATAVALTLHVA